MFGRSQKEKNSALYRALGQGQVEIARKLLERGADPNYATRNYGPVLCRAISQHDEETSLACVKLLLDKGASTAKVDSDYQRTPLHYAVYNKPDHLKVIKALIDAGSDVNTTDWYGSTPLVTAVGQREWQVAEVLLDYCTPTEKPAPQMLISAVTQGAPPEFLSRLTDKLGLDINAAGTDGKTTALHTAISTQRVHAIEWLLAQNSIDVNVKDAEGETPLQMAIVREQRQTVEWLLAHKGIDLNLTGARGETPLQRAIAAGHMDTVKALLDKGASPDLPDIRGGVPIVTAARANAQGVLEMLVAAKASLDVSDIDGMTALAAAAGTGSIRMVKTLLTAAKASDAKLDLQAPFFAAAEKGYGRVLELLIEAGADVNAVDAEGRTPLMKAVASDHIETLSMLIKAGAKPDQVDRHGMFAYDHAVSGGRTKAKDYLARYRRETVKAVDTAAAGDDYQCIPLNGHSLEVREGDSLTMTFNFSTQQVIFRDTARPVPLTVQNFSEIQRQEAIDEAFAKLKALGGNPPDPHVVSVRKKMPGIGK